MIDPAPMPGTFFILIYQAIKDKICEKASKK